MSHDREIAKIKSLTNLCFSSRLKVPLEGIRVVGSYAKETNVKGSDIDLCVCTEKFYSDEEVKQFAISLRDFLCGKPGFSPAYKKPHCTVVAIVYAGMKYDIKIEVEKIIQQIEAEVNEVKFQPQHVKERIKLLKIKNKKLPRAARDKSCEIEQDVINNFKSKSIKQRRCLNCSTCGRKLTSWHLRHGHSLCNLCHKNLN